MLDPVQQRIVGVLIEKQRTVPETYPLTENVLIAGCNQKSNRDPAMELDASEIHPALLALREDGWIARVEGSRATRYRHRVEERLNVDQDELAVLSELLCRGPQAPGALKPRVARFGLEADVERLEVILAGLAGRPVPLVEQLARRPRERDHRWGHLLGPRPESDAEPAADVVSVRAAPPIEPDGGTRSTAAEGPAPDRASMPRDDSTAADLAALRAEVEALRETVRELENAVRELRGY